MKHFLWFTYMLSFFAFFSCISLTIWKDLDRTILTQCPAYNILPTVSASVAFCFPQFYIWRFCFALTCLPRYIIGYLQMEYRILRSYMASPKRYRLTERINGVFHFLELTCLFLLTYVSLSEGQSIHVYGYLGFVFFSLLHMLFTVGVDYLWSRTSKPTELEKKSRAKRCRWFLINLLSFLISTYFYLRSNNFCEPMIYSLYSLFEYFVILTNIAYHGTVIEEWHYQGHIQIRF